MSDDYYSENWNQATEKFVKSVPSFAHLKWCVADGTTFDIPYITIGRGPQKYVVNSGVHGLEGYFGSAAQIWFLRNMASQITESAANRISLVLIHVINGWGMQNRMREVLDEHGGLVDLNRNFGVNFSAAEKLPSNPLYEMSHDLLLSRPDAVAKKNAIQKFYLKHRRDGAWDAISRGQYLHPDGLFYGGSAPTVENKMTLKIYDEIASNADSLTSIGLHTGLGRFNARRKYVTANLMVSHPANDWRSEHFRKIFGTGPIKIQTDPHTATSPVLLGDLVDCLDARYGRDMRVATADLEIGTGQFPVMSPIYKRMDMGDARYDLKHGGQINPQTKRNLTESWYPSSPVWRGCALDRAADFWRALVSHINRTR